MRFRSFLKEIKKQRKIVEKRKKRKADELSNPIAKPVRKKIRVQNQSQTQVPSSPPSSLSPLPPLSALSPSSAPSSSSHVWLHDVFPSFRGEDVRKNFLSHIKKEFKRKTITFFNDNGIERGESIAPELIRGIRGSKIAIVLLSKNYASSKWCLEELVEIMNCREELGQTVMAIFYEVDPSDVKKLNGDFGKVFRKTCEGKSKEDIRRWKQALEKVATIAGYHSCNWVDEAAMIEDISTDVFNKLNNSAQSSDFDNLVGMSTHMIKLKLLLRLGSNEVRMIGIWGPSGIGKSTIARVLFSHYSREFQFSVFMENIKRRFPRPYYDEYSAKLQLQKEFMYQIVNQEDMKIQHLGVVEDRLKDKRVLAILDDVDHSLQIEAIAKEARWFGPGSRIIITTQDKSLLNARRIDDIYEVEFPPDDEALEIFCMYAFGQKSPHDGFKELAWEVTKLAGNLPLGLKVIGSYFEGRPKQEWEEDLPRLRSILDGEIESILKFSYDALRVDDQDLFLHLACFFNDETLEIVEGCLEKNFVGVKGRLRGLAEKAFISFEGGYTEIHDLLARFGREIVHKQSIREPGQRQFLVDAGDICQVLCNDTLGSRNVIGIDLDFSELDTELKISDGVFERMSNVQFLRVKDRKPYPYSIDPMTCLPRNLRILHWDYFPLTCLPSNLSDTGIQETAPWVKKERSRIRELVIKRCTEQVSFTQDCKFCKRHHFSLYKHESNVFIVINCLKLNQETRDLIIKTSTRDFTILPGETVPTYFSYRAAGSSLSMTWNGLDTEYFPTSLRFRACLLLVYKGHVGGHRQWSEITYCIKDKLTGVERYSHRFVKLSPTPDDHLFVFEIEETVSAPELVFEFGFTNKNWEIKKCGLHPLETPSC